MDYDARKDSLLSEEESQKVEILVSCLKVNAYSVVIEAFLEEGNRPRKNVFRSKPTKISSQKADFVDSIVINYFFELRQKMYFQVFDVSSLGKTLIGKVETTVGELFNRRKQGVTKGIMNQDNQLGQLHISCEKVERGSKKFVEFQLKTSNLETQTNFLFFDCCKETKVFWKLFKKRTNREYILHQSQPKIGGNNRYQKFKISQAKLCNNDQKQPIILRFYKQNNNQTIGQCRFDRASMKQGHIMNINNNGKEKGVVTFVYFNESIKHEFTDFLTAGMQMAMVLCVDFTASNGLQNSNTSLHYHTQHKKSQYEQALQQVCSIVLDYDADKLVPCFGFGAKVNMPEFCSQNKVHHCFPLNGSQHDPNIYELAGIIQGYRKCLPYLQFSGPTLFAPLIREAMDKCEKMKAEKKEYMILLILTDGVINDYQQTADLIVKCGKLPLSIIIIGIGKGDDWSSMVQLDNNEDQLRDSFGNSAPRDLVRFVEFQKHNNNSVQLASDVLFELPRQVEEYHELNYLEPSIYKDVVGDIARQREINRRQ